MTDLILIGGGLANTLLALRLKERAPEINFLLLEAEESLGGNHTWSFHGTDLPAEAIDWLIPFVGKVWPEHEVRFPKFKRIFQSPYYSIRSVDFSRYAMTILSEEVRLKARVRSLASDGVELEDGEKLSGHCVIDGRGWEASTPIPLAYQKFLGRVIRTKGEHGLKRPCLMDATCAQLDGYRFFYILPWSSNTLLIEDTRYSDTPDIEEAHFRSEIEKYCLKSGWEIEAVEHEEKGCLPIPLGGKMPRPERVGTIGVRAGLFHATTGYSLGPAVECAFHFASRFPLSSEEAKQKFAGYSERVWKQGEFFRLLNRMLFRAAEPERRYKVLQRFYQLSESLVARFYQGRLTRWDKFRILAGRPPVPIRKALRCMAPITSGEGQ